jgi:hypothetical protein
MRTSEGVGQVQASPTSCTTPLPASTRKVLTEHDAVLALSVAAWLRRRGKASPALFLLGAYIWLSTKAAGLASAEVTVHSSNAHQQYSINILHSAAQQVACLSPE